jgi:hypothetical protein
MHYKCHCFRLVFSSECNIILMQTPDFLHGVFKIEESQSPSHQCEWTWRKSSNCIKVEHRLEHLICHIYSIALDVQAQFISTWQGITFACNIYTLKPGLSGGLPHMWVDYNSGTYLKSSFCFSTSLIFKISCYQIAFLDPDRIFFILEGQMRLKRHNLRGTEQVSNLNKKIYMKQGSGKCKLCPACILNCHFPLAKDLGDWYLWTKLKRDWL